jgi:outer membrane protein assembly factor BamB
VNRLIILILSLLLLNHCSSNEKLRIWKSKEKNLDNNKNIKKLFSDKKKIITEFNQELKLDLSKIRINEIIVDNQNNFGALNYDGLNKKIGSYKFSKMEGSSQINYKPIFLDDGLIFFDKNGNITRYDSNNKIIWRVNHYSKSEKKMSPKLYFVLDNHNLLITDSVAKYYSINIKNGELNWLNIGDYSFNSEIKIADNKFFAIDFKNTLRCYNIVDGEECWNLPTEESFTIPNSKFSLIIIDGIVVFSNSIGDITAVDIETGLITWQLPTQSSSIINETYSFKVSKLVSDNRSIYFSNNKNQFYSVDVRTGTINWINEINSNLTPIVSGNLIFTVSNEGFLYVIEKNNGNIIRVTNLYKNYKEKKRANIKPIGFVIGKTNLYLSNDNGKLIVVDLITGSATNTIKISNSFVSEPFIFNKNLFIIKNGSIIQYN